MTYQVQLEVFEGPLDLLLHLIERSELDIYDIPIAVITEQFLSYLHTMELLNLETAGEFLVMAATLMQIKAKMLLPKPVSLEPAGEEEEDDPRKELVDRLLEYRRIKEAAGLLKQMEAERAQLFSRAAGEFADQLTAAPGNPLTGVSIWDLIDAFQAILAAATPEETAVLVPAEQVSVKQIMADLLASLRAVEGGLEFTAVFSRDRPKRDLITAFVALLELIKLGRVMAYQDGTFGRIVLRLRPGEEVKP